MLNIVYTKLELLMSPKYSERSFYFIANQDSHYATQKTVITQANECTHYITT